MATLKEKLKKAFYLFGFGTGLLIVFVLDLIRGHGSIDVDGGPLSLFRDGIVIVAFGLFYLLIESLWRRDEGPSKKIGLVLVLMIIVVGTSGLMQLISTSGFDVKNDMLLPNGFDSVLVADIYGIVLGTTMIIVLLILRDIILWKRRQTTRRNLLLLFGSMVATSISMFSGRPLDQSVVTSILQGVTIVLIVVNSFRLTWIVYLTKREKLFSMVYGFLLFCIFIGFDIMKSSGFAVGKSLLFYSPPLYAFITSVGLLGTIYFGMTFLSTMFHLPTAEAYDRKTTEVASLHNLSRLITQVFDFNELVESVTRMSLEVCQAQSAWLEIIPEPERHNQIARFTTPSAGIQTVALNNITESETSVIVPHGDESLRSFVIDERKAIVIDDVQRDSRTKHIRSLQRRIGSIIMVPLVSHERVIGVLYATKEMSTGFDKEDVDLLSAFADQATIAIENSRLIEKSLERERLMREMMLAQEMQKKLLPQRVPSFPQVEIEALSSPAFEVGGDYYDFAMLDEHRLGLIVGDVSGKGVSAAFYMAEMKGIFQSLSKIYPTPSEFLIKAHAALSDTIDRKSFISVIYAVLDLRSGQMSVARAGHCPMIHISGKNATFVQPRGMGLGMGSPEMFAKTIVQETINLKTGDAAVFFTDGITEARPEGGEEFGYEQFQELSTTVGDCSAMEIRDAIIGAVDRHMNHQSPEDDLTLIVLKWRAQQTHVNPQHTFIVEKYNE